RSPGGPRRSPGAVPRRRPSASAPRHGRGRARPAASRGRRRRGSGPTAGCGPRGSRRLRATGRRPRRQRRAGTRRAVAARRSAPPRRRGRRSAGAARASPRMRVRCRAVAVRGPWAISSTVMEGRLHPALRELSDAVLAVAAQRSVDEVLQGLVERARELAGARYAALGIPDGDADQELIELLAAHAAIAITNARLYERSRELSMMSERNRLALELHDVVSQKLFGLVLTAESAATLFDRDAAAARGQVERLQD